METDSNNVPRAPDMRTETLLMFGKKIEGHPLVIYKKVAAYGLALNFDRDNIPGSARRMIEPEETRRYFVFHPHAHDGKPNTHTIIVGDVLFYGSEPGSIRENYFVGTWDATDAMARMAAVKKDIPDAEIVLCNRCTDGTIKYHARSPLEFICERQGIDFSAALSEAFENDQ